jgi:hypothetical protein
MIIKLDGSVISVPSGRMTRTWPGVMRSGSLMMSRLLGDLGQGVAGADGVQPGAGLDRGGAGQGEHLSDRDAVAVADLGPVEHEDLRPPAGVPQLPLGNPRQSVASPDGVGPQRWRTTPKDVGEP